MILDIDNFGEWQKTERIKQGMTQPMLAETVGVSTYSVWAYENGKKNPTLFTMLCIADSLGYKLSLNLTEQMLSKTA